MGYKKMNPLESNFTAPSLPANEESRLRALHELEVLDTLADPALDSIVKAASLALEVPISLISLVDRDRQWFKAREGLDATQTPRDISFCGHAILEDRVFEVSDALADHRFSGNPLVTGEPNIRFYAGAPIALSDGHRIGTLCVIDRKAKHLSDKQREILNNLAVSVASILEISAQARRAVGWQKSVELGNLLNSRLAAIVTQSDDAIISKDVYSNVTSWNKAAERMFGYTESEMLGRHITNIFPHDKLDEEAFLLGKIQSGQTVRNHETVRKRSDGTFIPVAVSIAPLYDEHGTFVGVSKFVRDISQRIETENALRMKEVQYKGLVDSMYEGLVVQKSDGTIVACNSSAENLLGMSRDQMLGVKSVDPTWRCVHEDMSEWPGNTHPAMEALKTGQDVRDAVMGVFKANGNITWISINSKPIFESDPDRPSSVITTFADITARKNYEESLEKAMKLAEAASRSKGQFLANMSHEIRTPMNAILGLLDLLQSTELTDRQRDYAAKTDGAAHSLLSLLNDILDFSKVEAGKVVLENEPFHIEKLLRNLSTILSSNLGSKDIEVLFDIDPTLPAVVRGDSMRLQQVLINLGGNAVKFTTQGQVVLAMRKLSQQEKSVTIQFEVQDTGIGIAPEHQDHIFSGFSQAEGSTTRRFGGTGLGLAISKRFVELMGGNIEITSEPGIGSTFAFALEMLTVKADSDTQDEPDRPVISPQRVLVVDDNPIAGALTLRIVRSWGWTADLANSGMQALNMAASKGSSADTAFPYPVIYMDWKLPDMDGWEVTRRIREMAKVANMPQPLVIMTAAHGREALASRTDLEQDMINGFLVKPVTASMLYVALRDVISGNNSIRRIARGSSGTRQLLGMRILVVEDNLINQQVADELLTAQGAIVSLSANGQLGVDAVAAAAPQFDVVLMDVQMPVLDGYQATRIIRNELGITDLPIVAMTANAMASDRDACIAAGMNEHIGKPFDMKMLVSTLIRMTGLQPPPSSTAELLASPAEVPNAFEIAGLELQSALNRMSGMHSLYVRTARDFVKIMDTVITDIQECLAAGDENRAIMRLHTLKGNAGSLGATELAAKAAKLEKLCATTAGMQECEEGLGHFEILVRSTQKTLNEAIVLLEPHTAGGKPIAELHAHQPVSQEAIDALRRISEMANASELDALQEFAQAREVLNELPMEFIDALDLALQELDLDLAGTLCEKMLSKLYK